MPRYDAWHRNGIASVIKVFKDDLPSVLYKDMVEDFVYLFQLDNPHFKATTFRKACGVKEPFELVAKVPKKGTRKGVGKYNA
jgi:hypothetical protein